jgi:hypothetical protein
VGEEGLFSKRVTAFWRLEYGLGGCAALRSVEWVRCGTLFPTVVTFGFGDGDMKEVTRGGMVYNVISFCYNVWIYRGGMVYTTLFPCGYVTFGDEAMRRYITLFPKSVNTVFPVYSSILNNRTSVRPLHRRNALALLLIQRPHRHFSGTPLYIVTNLPLPRKAMLHPGLVVAFFVVVSRMRAPTLSPRQRRFTRLHSVGQEITQLERFNQVRVPNQRAVGDADVG